MLLRIENDNVEVVKECHKKHAAIEAIDRVKDELEGVLEYKQLAVDVPTKNKEYLLIAMQEFQHMLVALDSLYTAITPELSAEEKVEFNKFLKSVQSV